MKSLYPLKEAGSTNFVRLLFLKNGYTKNSSVEEINTIFKKICQEYHPDKNDEFKDFTDEIFPAIVEMRVFLTKEAYENSSNRRPSLSSSVS